MKGNRKIRVAITHGDTNGIGYEMIFKAFEDPAMFELCIPIIYGSAKVAAYHRKSLGLNTPFSVIHRADEAQDGKLNILPAFDEEVKVELGQPTEESGWAAQQALERAMTDYHAEMFDVLVTLPVHVSKMQNEHFKFCNQADFISYALNRKGNTLNIMTYHDVRIASMTHCLPLTEVSKHITTEAIVEKTQLFFNTLKRDFGVGNPRIALLALNPGNEDGGFRGNEETEVIKPAVMQLNEKQAYVFGPYAADTFFSRRLYHHFDGVLAMYGEQATVPFKLLADDMGLEVTAGLSLVHTSIYASAMPEEGCRDSESCENRLRNAIYTAIDNFRNRIDYDGPFAEPLKKLYHERKDDSEKVRFNVSKKQESKD